MIETPHIAVIILNWNGLEDTRECLDSLAQVDHKNVSYYLIDNASKNDELKSIKHHASSLKLPAKYFQNDENLGFAGGNNVGIRQALADGADWIFLLNNDTVVEPDFLEKALAATHPKNPKNLTNPIGVIATTMINYYERDKLDNTGHLLLSNGDTIPRTRNASCKLVLKDWSLRAQPVFGACGGAAMYSAKMLKKIGLLDEDFFLNYEDSDLSLRGIVTGWDCVWAPESKVYHKLNRSIKKIKNLDYSIRSQRNQLWAYLHNTPLLVIFLNLPWIILRDLLVVITSLLILRWKITALFIRSRWQVLKSLSKILKKRRQVQGMKKMSAWTYWQRQTPWFATYWHYFQEFVLQRKQSMIE